jgi:hypothetical protein
VACTNRPSPHRDEAAVTPAGTTAILLDELEGHCENLSAQIFFGIVKQNKSC